MGGAANNTMQTTAPEQQKASPYTASSNGTMSAVRTNTVPAGIDVPSDFTLPEGISIPGKGGGGSGGGDTGRPEPIQPYEPPAYLNQPQFGYGRQYQNPLNLGIGSFGYNPSPWSGRTNAFSSPFMGGDTGGFGSQLGFGGGFGYQPNPYFGMGGYKSPSYGPSPFGSGYSAIRDVGWAGPSYRRR